MAAAQAILSNGFIEQRTSAGIKEAGEAVGLVQGANLYRLSRRLRKMNTILGGFLADVEKRCDASIGSRISIHDEPIPTEDIGRAVHSLVSLFVITEEVCARIERRGLMNYSRFGISNQIAALKDYSDRLWGIADWLQLLNSREDVRRKMEKGLSEIDRGDFVTIG